MKNKFRSISLIILFGSISSMMSATVLGPVQMEIIGYDTEQEIVFLTQTWWAEVDGAEYTNLIKYHIRIDSIEIIREWANRYEYKKKKDFILKINKLDNLIPINISNTSCPFSLAWKPKIEYYNKVSERIESNHPFEIEIGSTKYEYVNCFSKDPNPEFTYFEFEGLFNLIHVKYKGECHEGNTIDKILFVKESSSEIFSRDLSF